MKTIAKPFGWLMLLLYNLTGSYGVAVILFAVVVNLILLPFMMKSKAGMMRMTRLQPKIAEIQKKHAGNQQKLNEEMSKLYREEGANPLSGCLWSLIPFPILIALYYAIRYPLTTMMGVPESMLAEGGAIYSKLTELGYSLANFTTGKTSGYEQIYEAKFITDHFSDFSSLSDKLIPMNYHFLGLDLSSMPQWKFWQFDWATPAVLLPALGLFLIPLISAFMSWASMKISNRMNPQMGATAEQKMTSNTMTLIMPITSIWIGFVMPAALGIYWIINSVLGIIRDVILTRIYTRKLDKEDAVRSARNRLREEELECKRLETEKLRAANAARQNPNTSKKKLQATQKQKDDERRAAADRVERAARRARLGISEQQQPDSQVGSRRYARGRAYVPDRYINPEGAEAATAAAAAESEYGASIDETAEETGVGRETADAAEASEFDGESRADEESADEMPDDASEDESDGESDDGTES